MSKFKVKIPRFLKSVRHTLAAINGLFLITGLLLLIIGIITLALYSEYDALLTKRFNSLSGFVIATGAIIFLTSILGFYGAFSQHFYFIAGYVVLLLIVLVFEVSIIIIAYGLQNDSVSEIRTPMLQTLQLYESRKDLAKIWDELQMGFECCGVAGRHDWQSSRIPVSCCYIDFGTISPFTCTLENAYQTGCASALGDWLGYKVHLIAITAVVVTGLQVFITTVSGWLAYRSKFEEIELES